MIFCALPVWCTFDAWHERAPNFFSPANDSRFQFSRGWGKICIKFLNGSNLVESIPDFLGSLQSLIGISPALNMLAWSDGFNLNCDSLELSYSSVIEEDLELTLIMPIAWETMFLLIDAIFRSILSPTHWAPFTTHLEVESWHYLCHSHRHVICHHISWLQFIINHVNSVYLDQSS